MDNVRQMPARLLDHPILSSRMFYPRRDELPDPFWVETPDGTRLACHREAVAEDAPTVVFFHGNGELVADYLPDFPQLFRRLGCNTVLAEYRGYGRSTGRPGLQTMLEDVGAVLQAVGGPDSRLVLFGRSIGSLAAIRGVRLRPHAAALVIESGIFDAAARVDLRATPDELGVRADALAEAIARELDPVRALAPFTGRTLIMHTRHDDLVAVSHAERLFSTASDPKKLPDLRARRPQQHLRRESRRVRRRAGGADRSDEVAERDGSGGRRAMK
jgi:pimeloyl-ACP methyl ester carboxylesterase